MHLSVYLLERCALLSVSATINCFNTFDRFKCDHNVQYCLYHPTHPGGFRQCVASSMSLLLCLNSWQIVT